VSRHVVVAGYGMAAARLVEELRLRLRDPAGDRVAVTVLGAEEVPAYNRVLLSGVLAAPGSARRRGARTSGSSPPRTGGTCTSAATAA
jgi:NAD(P)H-nitrite reductase large subunit